MNKQLKLHQILIQPFDKVWKFVLANVVLDFLIIIFFFTRAFVSIEVFLLSFIWGLVICLSQWSGNLYITYLINRRVSILKYPTKRIVLGVIFMVLYSVFAFVLVQFLMRWIFNGTFNFNDIYEIIKGSYIAFLVAGVISLLFSAYGYMQAWRKSVLYTEKLKTEMLTYKYEALRNQINPHFLFNSFNVLSDLIYDDQKQAVKFVQQMSGLFRYVLESRDKELVPLKDEMAFIDSYIFLLKTRFEDKIEISNEIKADADDLIVPMSLQLLIENAVKHNEASTAKPLKIELIKTENYIEVKNNLQVKNIGDSSNGIGMKNIHQQYKFFTEALVEIQRTDQFFSVKLPILKSAKS